MKKVLVALLGLCVLLTAQVSAKDLKIGYVDVLKVFNEYKKTKDYEGMLDEKRQKEETVNKLPEKKEAIIKMKDKLDVLKGNELEKQQRELQKAVIDYQQLERKVFAGLKQESDEKMKEVLDDIDLKVKDMGKKKGLDVVLNKSVILYGDDGLDLTQEVLSSLNREYKK